LNKELETDYEIDKIRNLTDRRAAASGTGSRGPVVQAEVSDEHGQTESLKKMRGLRKDIARVNTILGERTRAAATEKR